MSTVVMVDVYPNDDLGKRTGPDRRDAAPLWGTETERAIVNFAISGRRFPMEVIVWLARLKRSGAVVNHELGLIGADVSAAIVRAADLIIGRQHDDQFPVDVFQTGSGTSSNMNVNEVIASLTGGLAHPNDHVNLGQSSNDVVPTAVRLAACAAVTGRLLPALAHLSESLDRKAVEFADVVAPGRTHLMDAVPVLLGDEFAGYASQLIECVEQLEFARTALARVPLGGTAVGNGLGTHPEFAHRVLANLNRSDLGAEPTSYGRTADRLSRQGGHDGLVAASAVLNTLAVALTKIANDLRWLSSGPSTGLAQITLPSLQKGSSIMPGKVNPVIPEVVVQVAAQVMGNHTTITVAGMQGNFELNVTIPVIASNLLESIELLSNASTALADSCVDGIVADVDRCRALALRSPALATALNPLLGYDRVEAIVKHAAAGDLSIRDAAVELGVEPDVADRALDVDQIARGVAYEAPTGGSDASPATA
ncbi:MAG TPA: class II fumarate hydratase [Ilumatobacter sp.]|nr:class II fumarate hydratase [Ilumatobacter sp.]